MSESSDGADPWAACPKGELDRLVRGWRTRRRRRVWIQGSAAAAALSLAWAGRVAFGPYRSLAQPERRGIACSAVRPLLGDYVAGKLNAELAERIREHLEHCPGCRALYQRTLSSRA